ncbi:MAG: hypothetical protein CM15mP79_0740 [Methanobacteriota archaeon]|nr:MAG: hypothetical protein CM15mP79_0740 [Euryarchaeota archaeon]
MARPLCELSLKACPDFVDHRCNFLTAEAEVLTEGERIQALVGRLQQPVDHDPLFVGFEVGFHRG